MAVVGDFPTVQSAPVARYWKAKFAAVTAQRRLAIPPFEGNTPEKRRCVRDLPVLDFEEQSAGVLMGFLLLQSLRPLVLHEFAVNAVQYGALAVAQGILSISWTAGCQAPGFNIGGRK
ncbi:hypothetical protein BMW22_30075 (plasmid) [Rhizobium leguminosarum]|uniref:Uncharacterized protein n=1 Tax=Rhizobium leguminosarum TaxID=384 RepID=A0A1L3ZJ97_RHILE|nr:hypothetical protein BMW22_30075 [Rhizobium leguminosarum]